MSEIALRAKAHWGYSEAFMAACREELRVRREHFERDRVWVAERGGRRVGYVILAGSADAMEIEHLFVAPEAIGTGIGTVLLQRVLGVARDLGAGSVRVQSDPHADGFYERCGGAAVGTRSSDSVPGRDLTLFEFVL